MDLTPRTRRRATTLCLLGLAVMAVACRDRGSASAMQTDEAQSLPVTASMPPMVGSDAAPQAIAAASGKVAMMRQSSGVARSVARSVAPQQPIVSQPTGAPSMIIRNGQVSVQVDSLEAAMDAVRRLAGSLGGYIGNVSISTGQYQVRSASLEMKIPTARFDDAMQGMKPLGEVEHSTATAQDVGEEFVDVSARIANAKRLEARLVGLLATRTGKLEDVLAVERELARVREEIERYEGRLRYLSTHIATSTIVATVHEKAPIVASQPGRNPIRAAFVNMWRNFVLFVAWGIEAMGVVIPIAALAFLMFAAWRRWRRARVAVAV